MRIEKLFPAPDRAGRYRVQLEDGSVLRLYRQTVEDFALYSGKEMTEEEFSRLQEAAGEMSAKMRAVRIVSASNVSKKDLQRRLVQKGENPEQAAAAVGWMEELELIDDAKTAQQVVSKCIAKGYGLARAKQALYEKQIPKQYWEEVLADYPEQLDVIEEYLTSHLERESTDKDIRRAIDSLIRRGHSYGSIRRVLSTLSFDTDELPEG